MNSNQFDNVWKEYLVQDTDINKKIECHTTQYKQLLDLIIKYVKKSAVDKKLNIIEIGCGTAIDSYYLAQTIDANFWGIDISSRSIDLAGRIGGNFKKKINLKVMDATKTDFTDGFFDIVFSQGVVEHFKDPVPIMNEQRRILADDGILIVDVPQKYNIYTVFKHVLSLFGKWPYGWERSYSKNELRKLGQLADLEIIESLGRGVNFELSMSNKFYLAIPGKIYNFLMRCFHIVFFKFSAYYLQEICMVFVKKKSGDIE